MEVNGDVPAPRPLSVLSLFVIGSPIGPVLPSSLEHQQVWSHRTRVRSQRLSVLSLSGG